MLIIEKNMPVLCKVSIETFLNADKRKKTAIKKVNISGSI